MFNFPKNLYCDVRIEDVFETKVTYTLGILEEAKVKTYKGAFIRIFDGNRWYYNSISNLDRIQQEIDSLTTFATPNDSIYQHDIVKKLQANEDCVLKYVDNSISNIAIEEKKSLLNKYLPFIEGNKYLSNWKFQYLDKKIIKNFYSSKGANLTFDTQTVGFSMPMNFVHEDKRFSHSFQVAGDNFDIFKDSNNKLALDIEKCEDALLNSEPVKPGKYTVILSPLAAGIFAHESFGHKSEADFMIGDEAMRKEWTIGKKVGSELLSIVDSGNISGSGYVPFDDEGTKCSNTYLVNKGILTGRLHSSVTASSLEEDVTGNARGMDFEFEPIVRMTTTYIEGGDKTKEELISEVNEGLLIETVKHGSGMSTFTIAPNLAYRIRHGKLCEPVNIAVISGNVMKTLNEIDGLSNEVEILSFVTGGCGKMEQYPLPVGFGGPYVRVNNIDVQ